MNVHSVHPKLLAVSLVLAVLLSSTGLPAQAGALVLPNPILLTGPVVVVNDGPGHQSDPHISGPWASYTDNVMSIRVQNVDVAESDRAIARPDANYDTLSDISGGQVVFARGSDAGFQGIYSARIDGDGNPGAAQEVAPQTGTFRRRPSVGNGTIAWEDRSYADWPDRAPEITIFDPAAGATFRLTNDTEADQWPAVSPDGSTVVWVKCASALDCDVWQATRGAAGNWTSLQRTTTPAERESLPHTDGTYVVYGSSEDGDENIAYRPLFGGDETTLVLPGVQRNPTISDGVILFESSAAALAQFDLFAYDLTTELLFQITNTAISEAFSDISVGAGGQIYVVWAQPKGVYPYDMDAYAFRFERQTPQPQPALTVQALFDQDKAHRAGSVVPIRFQLLNPSGVNVSSPGLVVTATGLTQRDNTAVQALVEDAGHSSPDSTFRYDESLGGYIYNLSTRGMEPGTWELQFTVSGDTHAYTIQFDLR